MRVGLKYNLTCRQGYDSILSDSIQLSLRKFWFRLNTWHTMTFQELIQINSDSKGMKFDSNRLTTQKNFLEHWFESTHGSISISDIESIQLMIQAAFQELTQNLLTTQADSPSFHSDQLMIKEKTWFWVSSWFDFEWYQCLVSRVRMKESYAQINLCNKQRFKCCKIRQSTISKTNKKMS